MTKKLISLLTTFLTLNILGVHCANASIGDSIVGLFEKNAEKKVQKANDAKDYSGEVTFMNNQLKLDKAFTKRYNQLQPNEVGSCNVGTLSDDCPDGYKLTAETTKKSNRENIEYWENQMMRANTLSALGTIYACATTAYEECHYIGGAGGIAKTVNGGAKFISKVAEFFGKDAIVEEDFDIREGIVETNVSGDDACKAAMESSSATTTEYLAKLQNCEHIDQVTLSGYTEEDIQQLADKYESAKTTEQSKANRLLTSASMAATGIGTMELMQGLSEQKSDRAADADMNAYISTMRCSYGNGKSVKAGADEIELPGGNDANLMKYRSEYTALANDLKERKTALNMMPGIESEEILDKSQMGLYDDENVGITAGNYASRYRAQMLGSESDQTQLDEAAQTSKTRVIGGAVAAGAGVVGGIVGDELINQSLSSSTKTAQTCTESGGTWQGGRCHCPDGYIQHTKTGPCFEEKPTEVQTTTTPQIPVNQGKPTSPQDNPEKFSNGDGNDGSGQSGGSNGGNGDGGNGNNGGSGQSGGSNGGSGGGSGETGDSPTANIDANASTGAQAAIGTTVVADAATTTTIQTNDTNKSQSENQSKIDTSNLDNDATLSKSGDDNHVTVTTQQSNSGNTGTTNNENSNKTTLNTDDNTTNNDDNDNDTICEEEGPDYINNCVCTGGTVNPRDGGCTCPNNLKPKDNGSCPKDNDQQRQVTTRSQPKPTAPRANTTNQKKSNTTNNSNLSAQDMSKNGTFAKAYSADGKCSVFQNKSWTSASTSWCNDLYKGQWKVQFDYGLVRGETACDTDGGVEKRIGTPAGKDGQYCWCHVIQYTPDGGNTKKLSLSWMYDYGQTSHGACEYSCAHRCASDIRTDSAIRKKMFNAK